MAARKKGPVFRVTGLPASQPDNELNTALKATIDDNLLEEEKSKLQVSTVIVPSCYDNEQERVALVELHGGVPAFLSELVANPLGDWQVEMGDTDISFDQHFFGFTQLYTPKLDVPVTADIIAITGLDGHAYGSWRGKGNLGRMWLRDFLSKDLPCCRTMIYGYNSKLSSNGIDTIMDYGRGLIEEIKKIRGTEELRERPLFFISHRATYGMLLFAIPHKGLVVDDIQKMLARQDNHPRSALLEQIRVKSNLLAFQLADFKNLIRDRKVVSFYGTGQTRQLEFDSESRRWKRTGNFIIAVDTDSALLQLPDSIEEKIPQSTDHSMIVKFNNKNDSGYASARDRLRRFEQDAPRIVAARFLRAQNRPNPSIMVPFHRDRAFVGREDILLDIREKHEQAATDNHSRVALVGLGGVGKSQIAIEYAYRVREFAPQTWVFWVHASNATRFKQAYRDIAAKVELPGRDDPKADILRLVYNCLCDATNSRWLMMLDNADDDGTSDMTSYRTPLESFLPQTPNGTILVTSRNKSAAINLVGAHGSIIQVEPMEEEDALALLKTRVPFGESSEADAKALVQALERIPLAITHAAAYIKTRAPVTTLSGYLDLFRESEANQVRLLGKKEWKDLRRDHSIRHAVIAAWQISFSQIQKTERSAADLLALMSMFDKQRIPRSLLQGNTSQLDFDDALAPLLSFSLVRAEIGELSFEMHQLVQMSMRTWLGAEKGLGKWMKESIRTLTMAFPSGDYGTWADCQLLIPHARKAISHVTGDEDDMLNQAKIALRAGWYLYLKGECKAAETFVRMSVEAREKVLRPEHPHTLTSVSRLGSVLLKQGKYEEAEAMHRRALEGKEKVLGSEHPDTLTSVSNLGSVLESQGKYEEAEAMHRRGLEGKEKVLGPEHPHTLTSVSQLGSVLLRQGKYEEAEVMHRRALEGRERVLGSEHPDTLTSVSQLGSVLARQGKYEEAEAMHRRALEGYEKVLGPEHLDTLTSASRLGSVLENQGKYEEAEAMQRRALEGYEKVLGPEHPHTLTSVYHLAFLFHRQQRHPAASKLFQRAYNGYIRALGVRHPTTIACFNHYKSIVKEMEL
ncbi:hypothetical protein K469DRAFT_654999 [Zopfia rhizophila CBS 207.26]|uniref:Uncharacterized protein n=1 Tax=Zopfia rhizophila CBS 207.26 TaxID=1314779 RepID=A0A6A6EPL1_9PEZI|nr:hypothetical protein K469DRAFT_654999 [Zopfia rhizophila CBS 207.26]